MGGEEPHMRITKAEKAAREHEIEMCIKVSGKSREEVEQGLARFPETATALRIAGVEMEAAGFSEEQRERVAKIFEPVLDAVCRDVSRPMTSALGVISDMLDRAKKA